MGKDCPLKALVCICTPFDIFAISKKISKFPDTLIIDYFFVKNLKRMVNLNYKTFEVLEQTHGCDLQKSMNAKGTREFEQNFTIKMWNFPTIDTYYRETSCYNVLHDIKVPTLLINAKDDPVVIEDVIPFDEVQVYDNLILCTTKRGGHLSWFQGFYSLT